LACLKLQGKIKFGQRKKEKWKKRNEPGPTGVKMGMENGKWKMPKQKTPRRAKNSANNVKLY